MSINEDFCPKIYDIPEKEGGGIAMEIELFPGCVYTMGMDDEQAEQLILLIKNKLDARYKI